MTNTNLVDDFAKELSDSFGPLLTQHQLAKLFNRSIGGLRFSLCTAKGHDMVALKKCSRRIGRRVYYPARSVAQIIMQQGGE